MVLNNIIFRPEDERKICFAFYQFDVLPMNRFGIQAFPLSAVYTDFLNVGEENYEIVAKFLSLHQ